METVNHKIHLIYTYIVSSKRFYQIEQELEVSPEVLADRDKFVEFLLENSQPKKDSDILEKVSCQVLYCSSKKLLPKWYLDCNGKIFFDEKK